MEIKNIGIDYKGKKYTKVQPLDWQLKRYANKKFGKLLVECPVWVDGLVTPPDSTNAIWLTHCDCGNDYCVSMQRIRKELKKGLTPDCGCGEREAWSSKYIGKTYNQLTIIARDEEYKNSHNFVNANAYYKCRCICGKIITARITAIVNNEVKSCGCLKEQQEKINLIPNKMKDLTGQKFGLLTALFPSKKNEYWWHCQCDCGNIVDVRGTCLTRGDTRSCGCISISSGEEQIMKILKENNIQFLYDSPLFKDLKLPSGGIGRYDFILLDKNFHPYRLIEYDGKQHFFPIDYFGGEESFIQQKQRDERKNEYCKEHNIPLYRIPYNYSNEKMNMLRNEIYHQYVYRILKKILHQRHYQGINILFNISRICGFFFYLK